MLMTIANVLDASTLQDIRNAAQALTWNDGARTAGETAREVKRNEQADLNTQDGQALRKTLREAIHANDVLRAAARPRRFSRLLLSRTGEGGGYGLHIDNALMGAGDTRIRADLSFTLFLSDPDTYEGGELVIEWLGATQTCKPKAGDIVLYPSTTLHRVETVRSGERLACVGWIESLIPDPAKRQILFDLQSVQGSLKPTMPAQSSEMLTISKVTANLLRLWASP